jgi:hypothetical protein
MTVRVKSGVDSFLESSRLNYTQDSIRNNQKEIREGVLGRNEGEH